MHVYYTRVCIWMCMCIFACAQAHEWLYAHSILCSHVFLSTCIWRAESLSSLLFHRVHWSKVFKSNPELAGTTRLTSQLVVGNLLFLLSKAEIRGRLSCPPGIYVGSVDSNSGPLTCEANFNAWTIFPAHAYILSGCFLRILYAFWYCRWKYLSDISRKGRIILT